jgi:DNA-binding LacI/PurR family transcriptional regulator/DNA-binding transcriptional regulator YhcF (GntR family)
MIEPVKREFLRDIAARQLRGAIGEGLWKEHLPSEAVLCRELHVSRRTVRSALAQLVREQWLRSRGRGLTLAIRRPVGRRSRTRPAMVIRYLSPRPREMNGSSTQVEENALREYVGQAGFRLEFECHPNLYDRFSAKHMKDLAFQSDTAAWVLLNATRAIQKWFEFSGFPCVVTGSCHEGVDLPNVEFDYSAGCFHAVHLLAGQGHEHVAYVTEAPFNASEQTAVRGFLEAAKRFPHLQATVARHDDTREGICKALRPLLKRSPRPTGYLVSSPEPTLTTLGFLQSQGVSVPADASVICCVDSPFLEFHIPSVARYHIDCVKSGHVAGALVVDVIRHGAGRSRHVKIVPEFVPGQTLV